MKRVLIAALFATLLVAGCGESEPTYEQREVISVSINTNAKNPMEYTPEEFRELSLEEIKEMIETYLPNYKNVYGIEASREMTDEDWFQLKDLMYFQLYGDVLYSYDDALSDGIDFTKPFEIVGVDGGYLDPDWIYYAPCEQYIDTLNNFEFGKYMNGFMAYTNQNAEGVDYTTLEVEMLDELRTDIKENLCVPWGSVEIPTVTQMESLSSEFNSSEEVGEDAVESEEVAEDEEESEE